MIIDIFDYIKNIELILLNTMNLSDNLSVISIANKALEIWGEWEIEIQESLKNVHEAKLLKLDISKAKYELNWEPIMDSNSAILKTIEWYKSFYKNNELAIDLVENDINFFFSKKNG